MRDFADLAGAQVLSSVLRFGAMAWAARYLGPAGFAIVSVAGVVNGYFVAGALSGLDMVGTRDIANSVAPAKFVATASAVRLAVSACVIVVVVPFVWIANLDTRLAGAVSILVMTLLPLAFDGRWALVGMRQTTPIALAEVASAAVNLLVIIAFVRTSDDLIFVPLAQLVGDLVRAAVLRRGLVQREISSAVSWTCDAKGFLLSGIPISGIQLLRSAVVTLDVVMVGAIRPKSEAGQYALASRFFIIGLVFLGLYYQVLLPRLVLARADSRDEERRFVQAGQRRVLALALPLVAAGSVLSPLVIPAVLGHEYVTGGKLLSLLVWALGLVALTGLYNQVLIVHKQERRMTRIVSWALVVNVLGNLILLPTIGIFGAPIAAIASELLALTLTNRAATLAIASDVRAG